MRRQRILRTATSAIFGIGRNALAYPDFARDALARGELDERRVCKTLTYCTFLMRQKNHPLGQFPTGCPPFDKERVRANNEREPPLATPGPGSLNEYLLTAR